MFLVFSQASAQAVFVMETMMEHVAKALKKSPEDVKKANLYQNGQVCLLQNSLQYFVYFYGVSWLKLCHAHAEDFHTCTGTLALIQGR